VDLIDPSGRFSAAYPCFEHPTLTDLLDARGISWRYYAPSAGSIWTGPDAIQHICQPQTQNGELVCTGSAWKNVIIPQTQVLADIANNQLAKVSWVIQPVALPDVQVLQVQQEDVPIYGEWIGTLDGLVNADVRAQVTGYLLKQGYQEGRLVKQGQLLFQIDPRPFQAALDQAQGQLAQAKAMLANAQAVQRRTELDVERDRDDRPIDEEL
jgi:hypothetical protein